MVLVGGETESGLQHVNFEGKQCNQPLTHKLENLKNNHFQLLVMADEHRAQKTRTGEISTKGIFPKYQIANKGVGGY